jgi:magnesium transporter
MLVNCVAYKDGVRIAEISIEEISDYLEKKDVFVWVALKDPSDEELNVMQREFDLHDLAIQDVRHSNQRPKKEEFGDVLFSVAHLITLKPDNELQIGELDIFTGKKFILSVRKNSTQDFLGVRARCEREPNLLKLGSPYVLYALVDYVVDHYFDVLNEFEVELDEVENQVFTRTKTKGRETVETLYFLKQKVSTLKHACVPLLEKFANFSGGRLPSVMEGGELNEYFRDLQDHLKRVVDRIDTLEGALSQLIQVNLSLITFDAGEISKRLAAWAGIFGLATSFAGIWGMNFDGMEELHWKYGYECALVIIFGGCSLLYFRFKKIKWL